MCAESVRAPPLISIIVAVRNGAETVERTLRSATSQKYPNSEIIVIDGASVDGTQDVVSRFRESLVAFVSEPDRGIADAYNKGIRLTRGEWVYFLNADDVFVSENTLSEIFGENRFEGCDVVVGKVLADDGRVFAGRYSWTLLLRNNVHHQAIFYRGSLIRSRNYNTQYRRYGHDHEHNLSLWKSGIRVAYIQDVVAKWRMGGISDAATWSDYREEFRVRRNVIGRAAWLWNGFTVARYAFKRSRIGFKKLVSG
jgi:putative colanic acid biosynthesis glycosyltransferase